MIVIKTRPYRVLHLNNVTRWSGGEIVLFRLLTALQGKVTVHAIVGEDGPRAERLPVLGVTLAAVATPSMLRSVMRRMITRRNSSRCVVELARYTSRIHRLVRQLEPDIVHINSPESRLCGGVAPQGSLRPGAPAHPGRVRASSFSRTCAGGVTGPAERGGHR